MRMVLSKRMILGQRMNLVLGCLSCFALTPNLSAASDLGSETIGSSIAEESSLSSFPFLKQTINDSSTMGFHLTRGQSSSQHQVFESGDIHYEILDGLRLETKIIENEELSDYSGPYRLALVGEKKRGQLNWFGGNLPLQSDMEIGASYMHRGAVMAVAANQVWWWTSSPITGRLFPWQGHHAKFLYQMGEEFQVSLIDEDYTSPLEQKFYRAHGKKSELNMGFLGESYGGWNWRFDFGVQRREMQSDSLFNSFVENTYPTRFQYRQNWAAPDSFPLQMVSKGILSIRDEVFSASHATEFKEKLQTHEMAEVLKVYYRHPFNNYEIPTEYFSGDHSLQAAKDSSGQGSSTLPILSPFYSQSILGEHIRGLSGEWRVEENRKKFEIGISGTIGMEWQTQIFHLNQLDTISGLLIRHGSYLPSDYVLQNGIVQIFASGNFYKKENISDKKSGENKMDEGKSESNSNLNPESKVGKNGDKNFGLYWKTHTEWQNFYGKDESKMEFKPSEYSAGGIIGWYFKKGLEMETELRYLGEKEVRGWGDVFYCPSHFENDLSLSQKFWEDQLKAKFSLMHTFGEEIQENPNANPLQYQIRLGLEGEF